MTTYRISDYYGGFIVTQDTPNPDKLIVTSTGFLDGVDLGSRRGWTVTVNGEVQGGLTLLAGNADSLGNLEESTITIGRTGSVSDDSTGLDLQSVATVKNYGLISSGNTGIELSNGDHYVIINAGRIVGPIWAIEATGSSKDTVTNTGTLSGDVFLDGGDDHFVNSGKIFGSVGLGDGDDFFKTSGRGLVAGTISLGAGKDTFVGGAGAEEVAGNTGTDKVDLGGGNDTFDAIVFPTSDDGDDSINGGSGIDTYVGASDTLSGGVSINLDKIERGGITANTATGGKIGNPDHIVGFENATGDLGNDSIYGSAAGNVLNGSGGADTLLGLGGNDSLEGGEGADYLVGGLGRDTLHGGGGADAFFFDTPAESGTKPTTRDVIEDFQSGVDQIYLTNMDADTTTPDNQNFEFFVTSFTNRARELRIQHFTNNGKTDTLVEGDVNGDGHADFSFLAKNVTLISTDFSL